MIKKKTWLIGAVAGLAAAGVLAVSQPAITSAVANETEVSTTAQKGIFNIGHRLETLGGLLGFGGGVKGGNTEAISQLLNMEQADLLQELQAGKSLVDIAKEKGITEQNLVDKVKAEVKKAIDEKVKQGSLTEEQAKALETKLNEEHIKADLQRVPMAGGKKGFGGKMGIRGMNGANMEAVAQLLQMEQASLLTELQAGKSLIEIAKDKNISEQTLIDTVKAQIKSDIDEKVKQGYLTEDQAKELETKLDEEHIKEDLQRVPMAGGKGAGFEGRGGFRGIQS